MSPTNFKEKSFPRDMKEERKLISCSDFVLENKKEGLKTVQEDLLSIRRYANFTNRTPQIGDFTPTDLEGNVLEKPREQLTNRSQYHKDLEQYQQALDRVIFKNTKLLILSKEAEFYFESPLDRVLFIKKDGKWICSHNRIADFVDTESGFPVFLTPNIDKFL